MKSKYLCRWTVVIHSIAVILFIIAADAHDDNHGGVSDPAIQQWYRDLKPPGPCI